MCYHLDTEAVSRWSCVVTLDTEAILRWSCVVTLDMEAVLRWSCVVTLDTEAVLRWWMHMGHVRVCVCGSHDNHHKLETRHLR